MRSMACENLWDRVEKECEVQCGEVNLQFKKLYDEKHLVSLNMID